MGKVGLGRRENYGHKSNGEASEPRFYYHANKSIIFEIEKRKTNPVIHPVHVPANQQAKSVAGARRYADL